MPETQGSDADTPMTETGGRDTPMSRSIAHNTVSALLVQATTAFFTAATTLFLIRALGPTNLGVLSLALTVTGIVGLFARFGIPQSLARFLANHRDDPVACAGLIRDGLRLTITTASLSGAGLFLAAGVIADAYDQPGIAWPLRGLAISLVAETIIALYLGVFIALGRISSNLRIVFVESLVEAGSTIALVAVGAGVTGAAFGRAIGYIVGAVLAGALVARLVGRLARVAAPRASPPRRTREILRYATPLFVLDSMYGLYSRIDVLLIGGILNATSVGLYSAPGRLMPGLESISLAVANSVSPRQAPAEGGRYLGAFTASMKWLMLLYAAFVAVLLVWAHPIVGLLFGSEYAESALVLQLLTPFVFLNSISPLVSTTVNYLGFARERIPIALGALIVNAVIDIIFLPRIGVAAAAIGTSAAFLVYVPAHLRICRREMGFSLRPLAWTGVHALVAATTLGIALALADRAGLTPATTLLGLVTGFAGFVAVLVITREISPSEARQAYRATRSRLGRRPSR